VKGISQAVPDSDIPREFLSDFLEAKAEIQIEHIEEDLEAERVIALYLMNHFLRVKSSAESKGPIENWWKPRTGHGSPLIDSLIQEHWDHGPFAQIEQWTEKLAQSRPLEKVIELGCGVGGLASVIKNQFKSYLGVDSSFGSIALGRHLTLGASFRGKIRIPNDLLQGPVSLLPKIKPASGFDGRIDFVVGDLENLPVQKKAWDLSVALNAIDMLHEPSLLPALQHELLKKDGVAIQSCPYIWHESVAKQLRKEIPKDIKDSASAVEWLYQREGFKIHEKVDHLPWLFFKHVRQLEIYSVHLFWAQAAGKSV